MRQATWGMSVKVAAILFFVLSLFLPTGEGQAQSAAAETDLRAAARDSYVFTYPLVMMYRTMYLQAIDEGSPSFSGGMGAWLHLEAASPTDTDIVTPNNDTPYSYAWVDLRAEPWVLTLPEVAQNRFYTSQWDDLWGYVLDNAGSVHDGNGGVSVLVAGPDWADGPPAGIDRVIQGESQFLGTLTRTQLLGPEDTPTLHKVQGDYALQPLSAFLGKAAPDAAPPIDWLAWQDGAETRLDYWDHVSHLLPLIAPNKADTEAFAALARIGIVRGKPFDTAELDADAQAALLGGIEDARALLAEEAVRLADGTKLFGSRGAVGQRYLDRALGVYIGIFGNTKDISVYLNRVADEDGRPLDGSVASYEMTFAPGQLPPVSFFWSMTMYRLPERLLVANPIDRYSIGSATPGLEMGEDGSLTLYISARSPGPEREANWLPAPEGPFWIVLRNYGPGPTILDRSYQVPPVRAIK
jgi:hypothetical protein